jgi:hypothetical protein
LGIFVNTDHRQANRQNEEDMPLPFRLQASCDASLKITEKGALLKIAYPGK